MIEVILRCFIGLTCFAHAAHQKENRQYDHHPAKHDESGAFSFDGCGLGWRRRFRSESFRHSGTDDLQMRFLFGNQGTKEVGYEFCAVAISKIKTLAKVPVETSVVN